MSFSPSWPLFQATFRYADKKQRMNIIKNNTNTVSGKRCNHGCTLSSHFIPAACMAIWLCLSAPAALAGVSMDTGGNIFSLEVPGAPDAPGTLQVASQPGPLPAADGNEAEGDKAVDGQQQIAPLPWGIVPEVYVPWLSGNVFPPRQPGGEPPFKPQPGTGWNRHMGKGPEMREPGFTDKAPTGAPARTLYPGMRLPLPGNAPQPVYPGEKPFTPGQQTPHDRR